MPQHCFNLRLGLFEHVAGLFMCRLLSATTRTPALWISEIWGVGGCSTLPWHRWTPRRLQFWFRPASSPDMPRWCPCASLGTSLFCCSWRKEGGGGCWGLMGWWVMVTQIMPHHTAYLQLTPNSAANSGAETQTELIGGVGFVSSYNFEVRHVFLWLLMWPVGKDQ